MDRPLLSGAVVGRPGAGPLCALAAGGLPLPGGALRELDHSGCGDAGDPAWRHRGGARRHPARPLQRHLFPGRPAPHHRHLGQERHPDRRVRGHRREARGRALRRGHAGGPHTPATHPDDLAGLHRRGVSAGHRHRRRGRQPERHRHRRHRRHAGGDHIGHLLRADLLRPGARRPEDPASAAARADPASGADAMRPARLKPLAGVLVLVLAGSTLDPTYHRPASPVPETSPSGPAFPAVAAAEPAPLLGWRDLFTDPKLKAVIDQALANNRDLRVAVANIQEARAQYQVQRSALLPQVNAQGAENYTRTPAGVAGIPGLKGSIDSRIYSAQVGFSAFELDLFGRIRSLTRAQQEQYFASEEARRTAQISLIAEVAGDYLTYGSDRAQLKIARDTEASGRASLDLTQKRLDGGVGTELDVAQARTVVEQARVDVARLTTQ